MKAGRTQTNNVTFPGNVWRRALLALICVFGAAPTCHADENGFVPLSESELRELLSVETKWKNAPAHSDYGFKPNNTFWENWHGRRSNSGGWSMSDEPEFGLTIKANCFNGDIHHLVIGRDANGRTVLYRKKPYSLKTPWILTSPAPVAAAAAKNTETEEQLAAECAQLKPM